MFPLFIPGESHASVCGSRSHALIPTGARSRPAALPKPIIISVPRPHCWKGSASKPYVELPPHTAPLGMEVGPAQACAVKVVVHDLKKKRVSPLVSFHFCRSGTSTSPNFFESRPGFSPLTDYVTTTEQTWLTNMVYAPLM